MRPVVRVSLFLLIPVLLCLSSWSAEARAAGDEGLPLVAVVTTGGTIAMKTDPGTGGAVPAVSRQDLLDSVPDLADYGDGERLRGLFE